MNARALLLLLLPTLLLLRPSNVRSTAEADDTAPPRCSPADRRALLAFKAAIPRDTTGILSTWTGANCCEGWEGIDCHPTTGRVTSVHLQRPQGNAALFMKGVLSPSLAALRSLEVLVIGGMKRIGGPIPPGISRLARLKQLYLEGNALEGTIPPGLGRLTLLVALSLSGNRLRGRVPASLGSLTDLVQINLSNNRFVGPIPSCLRNLHDLQYLDLSRNSLSGGIPKFTGHLRNLSMLDISHNNFSGEIPISMYSLSKASDISLSHNSLTGVIPTQVGKLKSLNTLSLSNNHFVGTLPGSLASLANLWRLDLSRNGFTDPLPGSFSGGFPSLMSIDLSHNKFRLGSIPRWVLDRREMRDVHLAGCHIRGTLEHVRFNGSSSSLESLDLSHNNLRGRGIGRFLASMGGLRRLNLSGNRLRCDISTMVLPDGLAVLHLHSNGLFGSLANLVGNATRGALKVMDLSRNSIAGGVPPSISMLSGLRRLDLSRNGLEGRIPPEMGSMGSLRWLDLSYNGFAGEIPGTFVGLREVRHASFRSNELCGEIPQGRPFNVFPASAYAHNKCLCGKPLQPCK